ncbi:hypothetical protein [Paracoccus luteus]|uniref:hypothetical protein n=1 Tax=Paracoccus luteus TaxID=2508543 RepID=UPI001FE79F67|nr:hypothetical protein [Paracoccus luteus]
MDMGNLAVLTLDEAVRLDAGRMGDIVDELGETAAQNVIGVALEQLAHALAEARRAAMAGEMARLVAQADLLSRLAWQMGLVSLAGVAVDVGACADRRDATALGATLARLMRVGNRSLTQIWDDGPMGP